MKLHSQGPQFFDDASDAYDTLFESDIFRLPESTTEYERTERQQYPFFPIESSFAPGLDAAGAEADGSGSSLPQALYLSYKNHGQFILDRIKHKSRIPGPSKSEIFAQPDLVADARKALDDFSAALDRDPSDAELWRRTARTAAFLKSARASRYCLEAAIELDDDPAVVDVEPPSLAEGFAGVALKDQLCVLGDDVALSHPIMKPYQELELPPLLKRHLDPVPFLPNPTTVLALPKQPNPTLDRIPIRTFTSSWAALGILLCGFIRDNGLTGHSITIQLPEDFEDETVEMEVDQQIQTQDEPIEPTKPAEEVVMDSPANALPEQSKDTADKDKKVEIVAAVNDRPQRRVSLPARKRSSSVAGLPDAVDDENGDTKRSKRTRRRDANLADDTINETSLRANLLQPYQGVDQNLFQLTKNFLENLGVTDKAAMDRIGDILDSCALEDRTSKIKHTASLDFRDSLAAFDEDIARILLTQAEAPALGVNGFLEHTKSGSQRVAEIPAFDESNGLKAFAKKINSGCYTVKEVAYGAITIMSCDYSSKKWSENLKKAVEYMMIYLEEAIYDSVVDGISRMHEGADDVSLADMGDLVQMLFELYLDIYDKVTHPNSTAHQNIKVETKNRLGRWMNLASELSQSRQGDVRVDLSLRFLWACVVSTKLSYTAATEGVSRDQVLASWNSIRDFLTASDHEKIELPNNAVMPEISPNAAEREISKITTLDFFLGMFQEKNADRASMTDEEQRADAVEVIDTLEPVLNPESVFIAPNDGSLSDNDETARVPMKDCAGQELRDLWKFLLGSSIDLRLHLWSRLSNAYGEIEYTTKQFSCLLKGIEMVITDMESDQYATTPQDLRRSLLMKCLRSIDPLIRSALSLALNDNTAYDIIDEEHIRSTSGALARLSCLLHVATLQEDDFSVGITPSPAKSATFAAFQSKLHEMQVRAWTLQYSLLKVGMQQNVALFERPENDLAEFLNAVHQVLGMRKQCNSAGSIFLKVMRIELLKQKNTENWEDYLGQVLYDLHGLKLGVGIWEVQDHNCVPGNLEKREAKNLVEKVTILANRMSMKDLLKSDLKTTIDHIQQAIGQTKSSAQMILNLRNFTEYLKKPIHPLHLYQAFTGNIVLDAVTVNTSESILAKHGWFFLLGMIALTKFKGVDLNRRQTPGATDDLRIGAQFLRLQLQFTPDKWDAWFRLAECFDYELDEAVLWTADKMNKERGELLKFQRSSIHCYTLALSHSHLFSPETEEDKTVLSQMYHNFAMRLYASSREPFAMEPFQHVEQERFFIENTGAGTFKRTVHGEMPDYKVWKYASGLFKRAMKGRPKDWKSPYMLSKCLWKMYQKPIDTLDEGDKKSRPSVETLINSLETTIGVLSKLPKPRHGQDPILEPHYKIVSILHKLVARGDLTAQEGADVLQRQPYAVRRGQEVTIESPDNDWDELIVETLRHLRHKDKQDWQHRIIMRHARMLYNFEEASPDQFIMAQAAFAVLRDSMVTKTMVINVWKVDAERPGRHQVYTEQYVRYLLRILVVMKDRVNVEALLRKIRKKGVEYYHFNDLWSTCVQAYNRLIRQTYQIQTVEEEVFKSFTPEEFEIVAERVNDWAGARDREKPDEDPRALNAMKEAVELKKLNGNLTKAGMIDDLISDCYSVLYQEIAADLPGPEPFKVIEERNRLKEGAAAATLDGLLMPKKDDGGPMALGSLMRASGEGLPPLQGGDKMERTASNTGEQAAGTRRRVGVRRADILRRAEQAALRATEPPKSATGDGKFPNGRKSRLGSAGSGRNRTATPGEGANGDEPSDGEEDGDEGMKDNDENADDGEQGEADGDVLGQAATGDGATVSDGSSPPRSVHDDADDESDLSDVPDDYDQDIPHTLMFPNLNRRSTEASVAARSGVGNSSSEDEESEEADDGEDEEMEDGGNESQQPADADTGADEAQARDRPSGTGWQN